MTDKNGDIVFQPHRHHWVNGRAKEEEEEEFSFRLHAGAVRFVLAVGGANEAQIFASGVAMVIFRCSWPRVQRQIQVYERLKACSHRGHDYDTKFYESRARSVIGPFRWHCNMTVNISTVASCAANLEQSTG